MSLLCRLGLHRPRGIPRWNDGFYFATCERCGRDLVRTVFQRWHVPKGYRVVWSDRAPASRPEVALIPEESERSNSGVPQAPPEIARGSDAESAGAGSPPGPVPGRPEAPLGPSASAELPGQAPGAPAGPADERLAAGAPLPPAGPDRGRLPIQEVLAQLNAEDAANRVRETPPTPQSPARYRRPAWDFMEDDPFEEDSRRGLGGSRTGEGASATSTHPPEARQEEAAAPSRRAGGLPERWRALRSAVRNFSSGPAEPRPMLVIGLALGLAVAVATALAFYSPGSPQRPPAVSGRVEGAGTGERSDHFEASAPAISPSEAESTAPREGVEDPAGEAVAYVAASLLSCREAPVLQARRIRNLARGQEVRVLGYDGEWASLAFRGGQCWAQAQYLSPVPPL
ncbi:MAG TPA: hypothetical protein VGB57_10005 [Allosphingosinicella sp.]